MDHVRPLEMGEVQDLPILRGVSLEAVWGLLEHCKIKMLAPRQILLERGKANNEMYVVLAGQLSIHLDSPDAQPVATLGIGQTAGEVSVIDGQVTSAFVRAAERTRLLVIDETTFWRMVRASHAFSANLLSLLAQRMRRNNDAISEGTAAKERVERESQTDALTGLHNRRWLDAFLPRLAARHQFDKEVVSVMMIDVDHFKRFNDEHGHAAGDAVLRGVGGALVRTVRPTDFAARYGGEELIVLLPKTDLAGARIAAERVRNAVAALSVAAPGAGPLPRITVSIGVAEVGTNESPEVALRRADAALYEAKHTGRDRVCS